MNRSRKTGDLVSQNNLFVDIANDRIGIGSTVPTHKLHVNGPSKFDDDVKFEGTIASRNIIWDKSADALKFGDSTHIKLGTDADIALYHNGSDAFIDNDTGDLRINTASGTIEINKATNEYMARFITDGAVELYHNNAKKLETQSDGVLVTGKLNPTGYLYINDGQKAQFGTSQDLSVYHSGSHSYIKHNGTGNLYTDIGVGDQYSITVAESSHCADFVAGGAVTLRYNGNAKLATTNTGVTVTGGLNLSGELLNNDHIQIQADSKHLIIGAGDDLRAYHNGSNSIVNNNTGTLFVQSDNISFKDKDDGDFYAKFIHDGAVELYYDNTVRFATNTAGVTVSGNCNVQGGGITMQDTYGYYAGTSNDLSILHDGNNSIIDNNTGDLIIRGDGDDLKLLAEDDIMLRDNDDSTNFMHCRNGGAVELYHAGNKKFETTNTGVKIDNASTTEMILLDVGGTNFAKIGHNSSSGVAVLDVRSEGHIRFLTGGNNERLRITGDGPHLLLGGTSDVNEITESSANAGMVIGGTGFGNGGLAIINSTSGTGRIYFGDGVTNSANRNRGQINYYHSSDYMIFATAGTERLRIDSVGRHGINVTNAGSYYSAADDLIIREKDGGDSGITIRTGTANSGLICFADGASATNNQYRRGQIRYHHNSDSMDFTTGGNTARLTIDSSGRLLVGTDVAPSSTNTLLRVHTPISSSSANSIEIGHDTNGADKAGAALGLAIANGGASTNAADLYFSTATNGSLVQRLWIKSDGKLGIGVNSPSTAMHLKASDAYFTMQASSSSGNAGILFKDSGGTQNSVILYDFDDDYLKITTNNDTERLRIDSSGRVLIGNTASSMNAAADNLIVGGSSGHHGITVYSGADADGWLIFNDGDNSNLTGAVNYNHASNYMAFRTSASERVRINANGTVLFGTTTSAPWSNRRLTVSDTTSGGTTAIEIRSATNGSGRIYFTDGTSGAADSYAAKVWYDHADDAMKFNTGGGTTAPAERLRIGSTGNLALGGTNTSAYSGHTNFFIGGMANLYAETSAASGSSLSMSNNAYINSSGNWVYRTGGKATNIYHYEGKLGFRTAGTGSAGATISWAERLSINSNGSLQVTPEGSTSNPYMLIDTSGDSVRFNAQKASGNNEFRFLTQSSGTVAEKLRIQSTGELIQYGNTGVADTSADDLVIGNTTGGVNRGMTIYSNNAQNGSIAFADNNSNFRGAVQYMHNGDRFRFLTGGQETLRLQSGGTDGVTTFLMGGVTNNNNKYGALTLNHYTYNTYNQIDLIKGSSTSGSNLIEIGGSGQGANTSAATTIKFFTAANATTNNGTERLRIDSSGNLGIARTNPSYRLHIHTAPTNSTQVTGLCIANDASSAGVGGKINLGAGNGFDSTSAGISGWYDGTGTSLSLFTTASYASTGHVERLRITSGGRLLYGNHLNDRGAELQYEGSEYACMGVHRNAASHGAPAFIFSASRGTSAGSNTIVQNNDYLGMITFKGTDGSGLANGAYITGIVDGTPGSGGDMPTRLGFWTSADGSSSPTERLRINRSGRSYFYQDNGSTNNAYAIVSEFNTKTSGSAAANFGPALYLTHSFGGTNYAGSLITSQCDADVNTTHISFYPRNYGWTEALRIAANGRVSISSDGTTDGLLTIKGNSDQVGTPSIRLLDGSDSREVSITNQSGDFIVSVHGNDNAIHGHIKMFDSGIFDINNGGASGTNHNRVRIDGSGRIGLCGYGTPDTAISIKLTGQAADGTDDGSDWGAAGIVNMYNTDGGTANSEILFLGSQTSGVGQISSGFGFGRESASNWGTYLSFKTHSTSTSNIDEITERFRITSGGRLKIKSPTALTGLQDGRIEWWNENDAGIMAMIACNRETTNLAPAGLDFYTTSNVDTSANSSEGDRSLKHRLTAVGNGFWYNNRGSGANDQCYYMEQGQGNHSWGTVLRLHVNTSGQDRAAMVFSSANGWNNNWGIGSPNASNDFRINSAMGYNASGWGTTRFRLEHGGTFHGSGSNDISDERLKDNITTISNASTKIKALRGVTFNWQSRTGMPTTTKYGFIAQEMNTVIPDLVCKENGLFWFNKAGEIVPENNDSRAENPDGSSWDIHMSGIIPVLVESLKESISKIETLETHIETVETKNSQLATLLDELKVRLDNAGL